MPSEDTADTTDLLATAVEALGGSTRDGQVRMANAVAHAIDTGEHLAVQAGTGTGKSLAYLVPAFAHATESGKTVVVSTATIALQRQLVERDLPRLAQALAGPLGTEPTFAILKGRSNHLCLNKIHGGIADEPDAELFDAFETSRTGREVTRLREWSSDTETGDRDDLVPGVSDRAWRQVSVTARECLGANNCSYAQDCFAEHARTQAAHSDVVVTNHAMLAIDALSPASILPEHDVVIIDEAHELTDRITAVATDELSAASVTLAAAARQSSSTRNWSTTSSAAVNSSGHCSTTLRRDCSRRCPPDGIRRSRACGTGCGGRAADRTGTFLRRHRRRCRGPRSAAITLWKNCTTRRSAS